MDNEDKFVFVCPKCGQKGRASLAYLGKTVVCPKCKAQATISSDGKISLQDIAGSENNEPKDKPECKEDSQPQQKSEIHMLVVHRTTRRAFTLTRDNALLHPLIENIVLPPNPSEVAVDVGPEELIGDGYHQFPSWTEGLSGFTTLRYDTPPTLVSMEKQADTVEDIDGDGTYMTSLHVAARNGKINEAKALLGKGADVNARNFYGRTPLHFASEEGRNSLIRLLVEKGADVNAQDICKNTPLHLAASSGHVLAVKFLVQHKAAICAIDDDKSTPLFRALTAGHTKVVEVLANMGANIEFGGEWGTPLEWAAEHGSKEMIEVLLEHGASINSTFGDDGDTVLHCAASRNRDEEIVDFLIAKGAQVNAKTKSLTTPLHIAAGGHRVIAAILLANGADPNAKDDHGWTPLFFAADHRQKEIVEMLINAGADVNAKNKDGDTPTSYSNGEDIENILRKHGGKRKSENMSEDEKWVGLEELLFGQSDEGRIGAVEILGDKGGEKALDLLIHSAESVQEMSVLEVIKKTLVKSFFNGNPKAQEAVRKIDERLAKMGDPNKPQPPSPSQIPLEGY